MEKDNFKYVMSIVSDIDVKSGDVLDILFDGVEGGLKIRQTIYAKEVFINER